MNRVTILQRSEGTILVCRSRWYYNGVQHTNVALRLTSFATNSFALNLKSTLSHDMRGCRLAASPNNTHRSHFTLQTLIRIARATSLQTIR